MGNSESILSTKNFLSYIKEKNMKQELISHDFVKDFVQYKFVTWMYNQYVNMVYFILRFYNRKNQKNSWWKFRQNGKSVNF